MYVVCVTVFVKPDNVADFIAASRLNHEGTRQEPGNLRWDFLQAEDDPTRFMLYEVYRTKDDFAAHQQTPHYLAWRESVAPWMAQPRQAVRHHSLLPSSDEDW